MTSEQEMIEQGTKGLKMLLSATAAAVASGAVKQGEETPFDEAVGVTDELASAHPVEPVAEAATIRDLVAKLDSATHDVAKIGQVFGAVRSFAKVLGGFL